MPAAEPKEQHTVHRAYLAGFLDPDTVKGDTGYLWVYMPGKSPFRQKPERVAKRNYYYCYERNEQRQFDVEHGLSKMEDAAVPILRRLKGLELTLSADERMTFAGYVALSHCRVPTAHRNFDRLRSLESAKQLEYLVNNPKELEYLLKRHEEDTGEVIDPEEMRKGLTAGNVVVTQEGRQWSLLMMFELLLPLQELIFRMHWSFVVIGPDDPGFVTSDNPVALFDPRASPIGGIGFASSRQAHFTFPISREICLIAGHEERPQRVSVSPYVTRQFNTAFITRADSQVYAPFREEKIQSLVDRLPKIKPRKGRVLLRKGTVVEE